MTRSAEPRILQFCHGYSGPFLDCTRQYASLFAGTPYKVTTVFLTGRSDAAVAEACAADEVLFMEYRSKDIRGLKLSAIRDLHDIAKSRNFSFCIAHRNKPIWIAALATRLPIFGVHHAFGDYRRLGRKIFANLIHKRLALLGVSDAVRDDIRANLPKWPHERIETLYNRVDIEALNAEQMTREDARRHLHLPADAWVVGNVGELHPDKDQSTLLRGFATALPGLPSHSLLTILGSGPLEDDLKILAAELGISDRVLFLGQLENSRRYFRAFDVFALTSDHEPFGMVLLEAMTAGVPLIVTACGGAREIVEGVGILFPFGHDNALASGLQHLAALNAGQRRTCVRLMMDRLQERFSDEAVRREFWRLPILAGFK